MIGNIYVYRTFMYLEIYAQLEIRFNWLFIFFDLFAFVIKQMASTLFFFSLNFIQIFPLFILTTLLSFHLFSNFCCLSFIAIRINLNSFHSSSLVVNLLISYIFSLQLFTHSFVTLLAPILHSYFFLYFVIYDFSQFAQLFSFMLLLLITKKSCKI